MRSLVVLALMFATMSSSFTGTHLNTSALENSVSSQNVQSEDSVSVASFDSEEGNFSEDSDYVEDSIEAPAESEDEMEDQEDSSDVENDEDEDDCDGEDYIEPSLEEKYEANMNFDTTNEWWDVPPCEDGDHVWYEMVDENDAPIKVCKRCGQSCEE